jgi:nitroreductase
MIELLRKRRSIRKYQPRKIDKKTVKILEEAALRSPSSRNRRPWEFIFVDETELIAKLAGSKEHGSGFLKSAPFAVVVCADNSSDVWVEDCSIASILLQLTAESLGLGSCWIQIRNRRHDNRISSEQYVKNMLNIPEFLTVESIIALGYPAEEKEAIPVEELDFSKIKTNIYQ